VIAIPAHAPHAVFTGEAAVKAVDAWSPVMENINSEIEQELSGGRNERGFQCNCGTLRT